MTDRDMCRVTKLNTPYTIVKMKIICIIADRIEISSQRFPAKITIQFCSVYCCSAAHTPQKEPHDKDFPPSE
jgi:hypothetical protein